MDMEKVITDEKGTGKAADPLNPNAKIFGKTGTAENPHGEDHAWFIGWMEYFEKSYSIVVLVRKFWLWRSSCSTSCKKYF